MEMQKNGPGAVAAAPEARGTDQHLTFTTPHPEPQEQPDDFLGLRYPIIFIHWPAFAPALPIKEAA